MRFADKAETSGRIGDTTRYIAFGIIALVFTIHSSDSTLALEIVSRGEFLLNLAGLFACLNVIADYLQYVCGYFSVNKALQRRDSGYTYDDASIVYRGRAFFFWAKQALSFSGSDDCRRFDRLSDCLNLLTLLTRLIRWLKGLRVLKICTSPIHIGPAARYGACAVNPTECVALDLIQGPDGFG